MNDNSASAVENGYEATVASAHGDEGHVEANETSGSSPPSPEEEMQRLLADHPGLDAQALKDHARGVAERRAQTAAEEREQAQARDRLAAAEVLERLAAYFEEHHGLDKEAATDAAIRTAAGEEGAPGLAAK